MKTFFVTLAVVLLALIIGCQENFMNEPELSLQKKNTNTNKNVLNICCQIQDPLTGSCNLSGTVMYSLQVLSGSSNQSGLYDIALTLEMNAELCGPIGMVHPEWIASGKSFDIVRVSEEGIALVDKTYWISNRNDVVLYVQYLVTRDAVAISDVYVAEIEK